MLVENNKPEQQIVDEDNTLLMKKIEDKENEDYLKLNFEEKIKNTIDKIMENSNDNELSRLFGYLFGYNLNDQELQQQEKQSKMEQIGDYLQSLNEIVATHRYSIDYVRVQKLVHELAQSSSKVFSLTDSQSIEFEKDLYRLTNYLLKKILNSFGIQEESKKDKSENIINDHLFVENYEHQQQQQQKEEEEISKSMNKKIDSINTITEDNIKQIAHQIVSLANRNPQYSSTILKLLDVENKKEVDQENTVASLIKVTLSFARSFLTFLAAFNEEVTEGDLLGKPSTNKNPSWLSESTMKDIQSLATKEFLNPRTIIALNKLFVRDSKPMNKYQKESLTHQLIDLGYSVLYGKNSQYDIDTAEGVATVNKQQQQQDKLIQQSVNQELVNRIVNLAYETDEKAKEDNFEGLFYRSLRLFFGLFHIDDYQTNQAEDGIEENEIKQNAELVPEEYMEKQEKNLNNDANIEDEADGAYVYDYDYENEEAGKIKYIAQRVNKLIDNNQEAKNNEIKRAENVFRILYKLYLYYYGYQDENELEQPKSNKVVEELDSAKVKRDNEELKFIQEVIPMLSEKDISNVLLELDRAANQLGYKSHSVDDANNNNDNQLEKKERDLSIFEYQS
ncbi:hypothetical protein DICPUDRAFT_148695 [Dictyostelium purpureum]|uniref:Uncharacterized protein n=1 Tax=Dictyostelium purpureum TaxID=5786 RepID=F0ZBS0_DICPU|nr:uncharacterized protein DICPUDRAFT_148695 [Dictyostelium purpureum]EGC38583.1 hypothetical protein DICPUDRAFT_148695 [Dictyostelium purpureum]|eukprot:XP_003284862.1 hypothetical protein DICPUDRAFT_148695 [Dictyostelium purpureum]